MQRDVQRDVQRDCKEMKWSGWNVQRVSTGDSTTRTPSAAMEQMGT